MILDFEIKAIMRSAVRTSRNIGMLTKPFIKDEVLTLFNVTKPTLNYFHINPVSANISITDKKGKKVYKGQSPATVTFKSILIKNKNAQHLI